MRFDVCGLSFRLTPAITRHVYKRVDLALAVPAAGAVRGVMVRLRDVNGPRGGVDKGCRIVVWFGNRQTVVVDAVDRDLYAAVDAAAARLKEAAWRRARRTRTLRREYANRPRRRLVT